jgi:hypothetical protein
VPVKELRAWNIALFLSRPVIIRAMAAALTTRKETKIASNVGKRKYMPVIMPS